MAMEKRGIKAVFWGSERIGRRCVWRWKFNKNLTIGRHFYLLPQVCRNGGRTAEDLSKDWLQLLIFNIFYILRPNRDTNYEINLKTLIFVLLRNSFNRKFTTFVFELTLNITSLIIMNNLLYINWDIDPVIFSLGPVKIQYYGLIFVTGLALCYYIIGHIYKKEKIYTPDAMEKLFIYAVIGIFGGARLGHCLFYDFEYFSSHIIEIFIP